MRLLAAIVAVLLCCHGCSKDGSDSGVGPAAAPAARIMFVQASPDAPPVNLFLDSVLVDSNIVFPNNTKYIECAAGLRSLRIADPGTPEAVYLALVPVIDGWSYTIFGLDSVAKYNSMLLVDDLAAPAAGKAKLRFVHASPNAPQVDLIAGTIALFTNEAFKSKTEFVSLDAGSYSLDVKVAGTPTVLVSAQNVSLLSGKIYTLYIRGFDGGAAAAALSAGLIVHN